MKKSSINGLKKELRPDDKLEKLVIDYAVRKTTGSRKDIDGVYYSKNGRHLIMASKSLSGEYTVCEGVREIDADAFWGCAYLEKLTIPEGVEAIGHEAFGKCISLREITIPGSVKKMGVNPFIGLRDISIRSLSSAVICDGNAVYTDNGKTLVAFVSSCKDFCVPEGVEYIGEKAFSGKRTLQRVTLPQSLKVIDDEAFFDCDALISITIPESINVVGQCAFSDCLSLKRVEFMGIPTKIKRTVFTGCENIREIIIPQDPDGKFKKIKRDFDDAFMEKGKKSKKPDPTPKSELFKQSELSDKREKSDLSELSEKSNKNPKKK